MQGCAFETRSKGWIHRPHVKNYKVAEFVDSVQFIDQVVRTPQLPVLMYCLYYIVEGVRRQMQGGENDTCHPQASSGQAARQKEARERGGLGTTVECLPHRQDHPAF